MNELHGIKCICDCDYFIFFSFLLYVVVIMMKSKQQQQEEKHKWCLHNSNIEKWYVLLRDDNCGWVILANDITLSPNRTIVICFSSTADPKAMAQRWWWIKIIIAMGQQRTKFAILSWIAALLLWFWHFNEIHRTPAMISNLPFQSQELWKMCEHISISNIVHE